jgi:ornithine carbamoyltransferase
MTGVPPLSMDSPAFHLPAPDVEALLHMARTLRAMARSGQTPPLLDSKHLGLLSRQRPSASQGAVEEAARGLGARVAWVPPEAMQPAEGPGARDTARLLGRLYDALDCEDLPPGLVQHLREHSGVPVYEGLGRRDHPLARLLPRLDAGTPGATGAPPDDGAGDADGYRFLLQAMLVRTLL